MQADPSTFVALPGRGVLRLSGVDRTGFLQGLVSNDVTKVAPGRAVYACLLTPQGKFLHDFFLIADAESLLIECEAGRRDDLIRRLRTFKLRSKIDVADATDAFAVFACLGGGEAPQAAIAYADPRSPALGSRALIPAGLSMGIAAGSFDTYDQLRIANAIPDGSRDVEVGKAILLENNIDLLNGIAWDKGCYMGQELTARTRYRGLIKKRLVPVRITGDAPVIGAPLIESGVEIGEMRSHSGDLGLALLRLEAIRQHRAVAIEGAVLTPELPAALRAIVEQPAA